MSDRYKTLIKRLEERACGGHPDGIHQDDLVREALDAIVLLRSQLAELRAALPTHVRLQIKSETGSVIGSRLLPIKRIDHENETAFVAIVDEPIASRALGAAK